jgi:glycosyltransferase involved in cell wall biosynthesis
MPCLNEERTIGSCIKVVRDLEAKLGISIPIIVADNGSTDESVALAKKMGATIISVQEKGYGAALDAGIRSCQTEWVVIADSDMSYDFSESAAMVLLGKEANADLVIGNRFKGGIEDGAMPKLHKYLGNPVLSKIGRTLFDLDLGDFHCGIRAIKKSSYLIANPITRGMEYATEMIVKFKNADFRIIETPVKLTRDGRDRKPHLRSFPDGWRHLKLMILFAPQIIFLFPGLILISLGFYPLVQYFILGRISIFGISGDINASIFAGVVVIVGAQSFVAGAVSIAHAKTKGIGKFRWMYPTFSRIRKNISHGVPVILMTISGSYLTFFASNWLKSGLVHNDPVTTARTTLPAAIVFVFGSQLLFGAIQVRQIISKFWKN